MQAAYEQLRKEINECVASANRNPEEIKLVVASKYASAEQINTLAEFGQFDFGENRAQALLEKKPKCSDKLNWHFIGQLQTNKVKSIIDSAILIHSLDRWALAKEIDAQANKIDRRAKALVEIRFSSDPNRGGIELEEVPCFLERCASLENLQIDGLMCIAPVGANEDETLRCFEQARVLFDKCSKPLYDNVNMRHLSMGMSRDYHLAIRQGSTMLRIGSALFPRT